MEKYIKDLENSINTLEDKEKVKIICEYASDAYEARIEALEDVPDLKGHPHFIDYVTKEEE